MKLIPLTRGQFAIVDDEDFEYLNQWKWHSFRENESKGFYAIRGEYIPSTQRANAIRMHRVLMSLPYKDKRIVDHINGNSLDNRRDNLRIATQTENKRNSKKRINNTSGYKGVCLFKRDGTWQAQCKTIGGKGHIGYFKSKADAAQAYILVAYLHYGEFARME